MVSYIRQYAYMVEAFCDGKSFLIPLDEILYFDTIDTTGFKYYEVDKKGHMTMNKLYLDPFMDMYNGEIISFRISKIAWILQTLPVQLSGIYPGNWE